MQRCPHCHEALDDGLLPICWHCGRETNLDPATSPAPVPAKPHVTGEETAHSSLAFGLDQLAEQLDLEPDVIAPAAAPLPTAPPPIVQATKPAGFAPQAVLAAMAAQLRERVPDWQRYKLPILGAAGLGLAVLVLSVMGRPSGDTPATSSPAPAPVPASAGPAAPDAANLPAATPVQAPPVSPAPAAAAASAPAPANVQIDEAPGWQLARRIGYASDGSRTMTLQLPALRDLQVSRQQVRPVLAVRCLSRRTEVFVSLGTSAAIEADDTNRVTLQVDDQPPSVQQWIRTDTYQELFAPDGLMLTRQLAGASLMRFTFTPFGSRPVVAEFNVRGLDQHVPALARTCGWPSAEARKR